MRDENVIFQQQYRKESVMDDKEKNESMQGMQDITVGVKPGKKEKGSASEEIRYGLPRKGDILIVRDNEPDLFFKGDVQGREVESWHGKKANGEVMNKWTRLSVYSMEDRPNEFVCVVSHLSEVPYHHPRYLCRVVKSKAEIFDFFQYGHLAKKLYKLMKIDRDATETLN